ncbi:MAG: nucleoside deaminase [candidate division KSB1 bacterium]|nr:nucleoside deaminase [candidate division KSB1 bacterium]
MNIDEQDIRFLKRAIQLAEEKSSDGKHGPFGAVIVKEGRILAEGWNQVVATFDPTAHAEVVAIRQACRLIGTWELSRCTLYASCEPCPMCLAAVYWARIERVVYAADRRDAAAAGFDDERLYQELHIPPAERSLPMRQALQEEGRKVLAKWMENPRRIPY